MKYSKIKEIITKLNDNNNKSINYLILLTYYKKGDEDLGSSIFYYSSTSMKRDFSCFQDHPLC